MRRDLDPRAGEFWGPAPVSLPLLRFAGPRARCGADEQAHGPPGVLWRLTGRRRRISVRWLGGRAEFIQGVVARRRRPPLCTCRPDSGQHLSWARRLAGVGQRDGRGKPFASLQADLNPPAPMSRCAGESARAPCQTLHHPSTSGRRWFSRRRSSLGCRLRDPNQAQHGARQRSCPPATAPSVLRDGDPAPVASGSPGSTAAPRRPPKRTSRCPYEGRDARLPRGERPRFDGAGRAASSTR